MEAISRIKVTSALVFFTVISTVTLLLIACNPNKISFTQSDPKFDWFSYEGNDPVYETIELGENQFLNPILAGFYPDPSITRAGDDYYLVHSSFSYYPGIPLFQSKDLVNWEQIGHVMDRPSQLDLDSLGISRGIFAPTIEYHKESETFYVLCTLVDAGGNFLVTTKDPAGDWSDPVWLPEANGIDPSIFFDDDGKAYILHNGPPEPKPLYGGHRTIWMWEYDMETQELVGDKKIVIDGGVDISKEPVWIEAPHLMKIDGKYYISAAEGGTSINHSQVIFRSDNVWGPYEPWNKNPILTQRHLDPEREFPIAYTGHADMVKTQNNEWWAVFLGVRPYEGNYFNTGRETFMLPVKWKEGWPVILEGDKEVPYVVNKPDLPASEPSGFPLNGNFSYTEDFDSTVLDDYWLFLRTPREKWYSLSNKKGHLTIQARSDKLSGMGQPSYVGRRLQHSYATISTSMQYTPNKAGDEAGLVAFQGENYYYFLKVALSEENITVVQLEKRAGDLSETVASEEINFSENNNILLKIRAEATNYHFSYSLNGENWNTLAENMDGTILSTQVAGGFVGTTAGMYAYSNN